MAKAQHLIHHPTYDELRPVWLKAKDIYEGMGGFLDDDKPYLLPHPREWNDHSVKDATTGKWIPNPSPVSPSPKLQVRRKLARYENLAAMILDTCVGALFHTEATRTFEDNGNNDDVRKFWEDADGIGAGINEFMQDAWITAAVFGHCGIFVDKDEEGFPVASRYSPIDIIDWLITDKGKLRAVKLLEAAPRDDFGKRLAATDIRVRIVDEEKWELFDRKGEKIDGDNHGFGRLPFVMLYGKRRPLAPIVGKPIIGDPELYIDVYNLTSETRELLRNQTFGVLNVPIGNTAEASVQKEMELIGQSQGTQNILFSSLAAQYISPDSANVDAYHEHTDRLTRMIHRLVSLPWDTDTKSTQSADSLRLKREDLNSTLRKYASELQRAEDVITELVYRGLYGETAFESRMETDRVSVAYSNEFETPDLEAVAAKAEGLIALELGETATKELKKRAAESALSNLSDDQRKAIQDEINAMKVETAEDRRQQRLEEIGMRMGVEMNQPPPGQPPNAPAA